MEKWGCWIAYHDPHSHQVYCYNHETTTGQWQTPPEVLELKSAASKNADGFDKVGDFEASIRICDFSADELMWMIDFEIKNVDAIEEGRRMDTIQN